MPKYTTIFFDWGGVIASDPKDEFLRATLSKVGVSDDQMQDIIQASPLRPWTGEISAEEYWHLLKDKYGVTLPNNVAEEYGQWLGAARNEDILSLAKQLQTKGIKVAVLSNIIVPNYTAILEGGYYDQFDDVIASCNVGYAKPAKEIYEIALERLDATAEQSVFIDDKQMCIDPAKAMGFTTVLARSPEQIVRDVWELIGK